MWQYTLLHTTECASFSLKRTGPTRTVARVVGCCFIGSSCCRRSCNRLRSCTTTKHYCIIPYPTLIGQACYRLINTETCSGPNANSRIIHFVNGVLTFKQTWRTYYQRNSKHGWKWKSGGDDLAMTVLQHTRLLPAWV